MPTAEGITLFLYSFMPLFILVKSRLGTMAYNVPAVYDVWGR